MSATTHAAPLTLGQAAKKLGCELWQLQALLRRGHGPQLAKVGPLRVVFEADLPGLADALRAAGYLPALRGVGVPAIQASSK
jgi:hypothetical protein